MEQTTWTEGQDMDQMSEIDETLATWDLAQALADFEVKAFPSAQARNSYAALIYLDLMAKRPQTSR
jgi:hypothetical protein